MAVLIKNKGEKKDIKSERIDLSCPVTRSDANKQRKEPKSSENLTCKVTFVLYEASLLVNKSRAGRNGLLNEDDHLNVDEPMLNETFENMRNRKRKRDKENSPNEMRPDIVHMCLLTILDSPLCKAGHIDRILVHTCQNKILEISPSFRVPRSWKLFNKVMNDFFQSPNNQLSIPGTGEVIIKLLDPDFSKIVESVESKTEALVLGLTRKGDFKCIQDMSGAVIGPAIATNEKCHFFFVVGAKAAGCPFKPIDHIIHNKVSLSNYGLSSAACCLRLCCEMEHILDIYQVFI